MVCSGTVVKDVNHPGKSNLMWTAGHCVHAGKDIGWYRNIAFVPSYNDLGESASQLSNASASEIAPYGQRWADWASTSDQWIQGGSETGGAGAAYDCAVLHVKPQSGSKSLEETVGAALDVDFSAPSATEVGSMGAWGYPAAQPYSGLKMFKCLDRPGRLSLSTTLPTMYRIGCTMDRRFVPRRLVPRGGRQDGAGLQHLDRPARQHLARRPPTGRHRRVALREHEQDVRRPVTRTHACMPKARPREDSWGRAFGLGVLRPVRPAVPGRTARVPPPVPRAPAP